MIAVTIPTTDVNSESVSVVRWYVEDRAPVGAGELIVEIETSKAILDVEAPAAGVLLRACAEGDQVKLDAPLAHVFDSVQALEDFEREQASVAVAGDGRIPVPARRRATELGLDIDEIARATDDLVSTKIVEAFAARNGNGASPELPDPLKAPPGVRRLVIIGAGLGATQVIDILQHDDRQQ